MPLGIGIGMGFGGGAVAVNPSIAAIQSVAVDSQGVTLGVISFNQAVTVESSGSTNADIATLPGVAGMWDKTATITETAASITAGADMANGAWTKTNCSATATGTGTQVQIQATGAGIPLVSQTIANCQQISTGMVPLVVSWWFSYVDTQFIVFQARASTTVSRVWLDVLNGAIGTTDAGLSAAAQAETRLGVAGFRFTITITALGGAATARFQMSSTDGGVITAPGVNKRVIGDDCIPNQVRRLTWTDRTTGKTITQPTVNLQPGSGTDARGPYIQGYGQQYMTGTDPTIVAAFAGTNKEFSVHTVSDFASAPVLQCDFSACTTAQLTNGARTFGQSTVGSGRYRCAAVSDSGTTSNVDSSASTPGTTGPHVKEWYTSSSGAQINMQLDGAAADPLNAAQAPGAISCDRFGILGRVGSSPNSLFIGKMYALAVSGGTPDTAQNGRISQALGTQFGLTVAP